MLKINEFARVNTYVIATCISPKIAWLIYFIFFLNGLKTKNTRDK